MKRSNPIILACAIVCGFALSGHATDTIIVNDTWADGNRTNSGPDGSGIDSAWFSSPTAAMNATTGHLTTTQQVGSATYTTYFAPSGSPVALANTGDQLKLTWVFTPTVAVAQANTSQNFRIALVNSPVASRIVADGTPGSAAYAGYAMFMNMSTGTGATPENLGNGNPFQLRKRDGSSAALLSTSTPPWTALANGATSGSHGYDSGTQYTFTMTLTLNGAGGLDIDAKMAGGTLNGTGTAEVIFTDNTPNSLAYDTFAIRPSTAATTADTFDTTLFEVEKITGAPEPSTFALGGLGLLIGSIVRFRRR